MAFGRCGVRVAKRPSLAPPSAGGCTLARTCGLSAVEMSQTCENCARPSSAATACTVCDETLSCARALGTRQP
eukprot:scaffold102178_cov69-Phaeocystis_antarctica.AAC.4